MEEPEAALQVNVTVPRRRDVVPLVDTLHSLMCAHTIPSQTTVASPVMNGSVDPERVRLRTSGGSALKADWDRYASSAGRPFWSATWVFYAPRKVIAAQWEHTKDRLGGIAGVQFRVAHVSAHRRASRSRSGRSTPRHSNGILSLGRYDIWPKHLRGTRA
jgi:hypothetical protein